MSILISSSHLFVHFVLPFLIKGPPPSPLLLICRPFGFFYSLDKSIGSGCFFPDLDPSVNLIGHAAITEMIKLHNLQCLPIGYEIKSGMVPVI